MADIPSAKAGATAAPAPELAPNVHAAPVPAAPLTVSPTDTMVERKASGGNPEKSATPPETVDEEEKLAEEAMPKGAQLYLLMVGLAMAVFLVSLDQTILTPAIPIISNQFNALQDVGWYLSAYFATSTALQPLFGRIYRLNLKWPFLGCITLFEVGSLISAVAQDSKTFIVGRAIAGAGLAGGYIGCNLIIADSVPLRDIPKWSGMVGGVYGLGAISGPLIGGAFTTQVTWRWCFYINLPLGGVTVATILLFFRPRTRRREASWAKTLLSLDWVGTALALGAMICFLLAMQDGGIIKPWSSARQIGLLVGGVAMAIAFFIDQWIMKDNALIPLRVLRQRGIWSAAVVNIGIGGSFFIVSLLLPIYYQLRGASSIRSGVQTLPQVVAVIVGVSVAGGVLPAVGYVQPFLWFGCITGILGSALFQLWNENSSQAMWAGTSFVFGLGLGTAFQIPFIFSQTVGQGQDKEIGSSIVIFFQTLGGAVWVAGANAIYTNIFKQHILRLDGVDQQAIIASGVTGWLHIVTGEARPRVLSAAMEAFRQAVIPAPALLGMSLLISFFLPWNSLKGQKIAAGGA